VALTELWDRVRNRQMVRGFFLNTSSPILLVPEETQAVPTGRGEKPRALEWPRPWCSTKGKLRHADRLAGGNSIINYVG